MIDTRIYPCRRSMLSYIIKPFLCTVLLAGIFCLVWLRSGVISFEYRIGEMERQETEAFKKAKTLEAEMSALLSVQRAVGNAEEGKFVFQRDRVFYVKRDKGGVPYVVSLRKD